MDKEKSNQDQQEPRMFVGGLFPETTSETLGNYFSTYGEVKDVKIIGEKQKRSRGFGFVLFRSMDTFHKVMKTKHVIDGREVDCNLAVYSNQTRDEAAMKNEKKIFIKKVPTEIEKKNLIEFFSKFGDIGKVLLVKRKNKDHAFAFVEFHDKKVAKGIIKTREFYIDGKYKIECEMAQPKIRNYLNKVNNEGGKPKKKKKKKKPGKSPMGSKQASKKNSRESSRKNSIEKRQRNEISVSNIVKKEPNEYTPPLQQPPRYGLNPYNNVQEFRTGPQQQQTPSDQQYPSFPPGNNRDTGYPPYTSPPPAANFNPPHAPPAFNNFQEEYSNPYQQQNSQFYDQNYGNLPSQPQFVNPHDQPHDNVNRNDNGPRFIHSGSGSISFKSNSSKSLTKKIFTNPRIPQKKIDEENLRFNKSNPSSRNSKNSNQDSKEDTFDDDFQYQANTPYLHPNYMHPIQEQPQQGTNIFNSLGPQLTQPQIIRGLKRQPTQPSAKEDSETIINQYDPDFVDQQRNPNLLDSNITPKLNEIIRPFPQPNVIYSENNSPFVSTISGDSLGRRGLGGKKKAYSAIYTKKEKKSKTEDFEYEEEEEQEEDGDEEKKDLISITLEYQKDRDYGKLRSMEE